MDAPRLHRQPLCCAMLPECRDCLASSQLDGREVPLYCRSHHTTAPAQQAPKSAFQDLGSLPRSHDRQDVLRTRRCIRSIQRLACSVVSIDQTVSQHSVRMLQLHTWLVVTVWVSLAPSSGNLTQERSKCRAGKANPHARSRDYPFQEHYLDYDSFLELRSHNSDTD